MAVKKNKKNENIKFGTGHWDFICFYFFYTNTFYCKAVPYTSTPGYLHARLRSADKCTFISINTAKQCQAIKAGSGGILVTFPGVRKPIKRQKNESSRFVCPCVPVSSQRSLWPGVMALTSSHTAACCVHVWLNVPVILTVWWFFFVSTHSVILATGTQLYYFEDNALRALVFLCVWLCFRSGVKTDKSQHTEKWKYE